MTFPVVTSAPWWRRVLAELVDLLLVLMIGSVVLAAAGARPYWHGGHLAGWEVSVRYLAAIAATLVYVPVVLTLSHGRTAGKWLLGIAVVCRDGTPIGFGRAVWREVIVKTVLLDGLAWLPEIGATVVLLAVISDAFSPLWSVENLALHDVLARTRVIRAPARLKCPYAAADSAADLIG
jgi:uncharacterized RDD family membrane protein YckC